MTTKAKKAQEQVKREEPQIEVKTVNAGDLEKLFHKRTERPEIGDVMAKAKKAIASAMQVQRLKVSQVYRFLCPDCGHCDCRNIGSCDTAANREVMRQYNQARRNDGDAHVRDVRVAEDGETLMHSDGTVIPANVAAVIKKRGRIVER